VRKLGRPQVLRGARRALDDVGESDTDTERGVVLILARRSSDDDLSFSV
jgi:hypothetical protein